MDFDPLTEAALDLLGIVQDRGDRNMVLRTLGGFRNLLTEDDGGPGRLDQPEHMRP